MKPSDMKMVADALQVIDEAADLCDTNISNFRRMLDSLSAEELEDLYRTTAQHITNGANLFLNLKPEECHFLESSGVVKNGDDEEIVAIFNVPEIGKIAFSRPAVPGSALYIVAGRLCPARKTYLELEPDIQYLFHISEGEPVFDSNNDNKNESYRNELAERLDGLESLTQIAQLMGVDISSAVS